VFPPDNPWNQRVDALGVHPNSNDFIDTIGRHDTMHPDFGTVWQGSPIGIPWTTVTGDQPRVPISFLHQDESDPGPYPIPPNAPIEGGSDRHIIVVDVDDCVLWEVFDASTDDGGRSWEAGSGARFDLRSNKLRPAGWTSADAAGLPILPGLVRYEEVVEEGVIDHALRFTVSQTQRGYVSPARHWASSSTNPDHPPMGLRLRMKKSWDCSTYASEVRVICAALKRYGMLVADNGSDWYLSGAPDPRWNDDRLRDLKQIPGNAFEVVDTGPIVTG
jgi:hypothetical protein